MTHAGQPFPGESDVARRMRALDWSNTRVGPPDTWPHTLRTALSICLTSPLPIYLFWGPDLTLFYNDPCTSLLGPRKHPRMLGRSGREAWAEIWDTIGPVVDEVLTTGHWGRSEDVSIVVDRDASHEERCVTFSFSPLVENGHSPSGLFCACTDTATRAAARQHDAMRHAEAATRAKDEFLALLGHELRNPLAPILTGLQLMRLKGANGAERERSVVERQVQHLVALVDDLLDISRITRGTLQLHKASVQLADVVARAVERARPLLDTRQHGLTIDVPRDPHFAVDADLERLAQAVGNLLTNAAQYTDPGGQIWVLAATRDDEAILKVRDTGRGIPSALLPRVFDTFAQAPQAPDRARGGLGLGLAIVKSLVELHGGTVSASSAGPGRGAEFEISLPRTHADPVSDITAAFLPALMGANGNGRRVLVVDDNQDAADLLAEILSMSGHHVRVSADARSALDIAREWQPDVALLDIGLPDLDGYTLGTRLRELPGLDRLRLLAVTGYGQESDRRRSAAAGFDHHLVKPVDVRQLIELLDARH